MPIDVFCPGCRANLKVADDAAGKVVQCPTCKMKLKAPGKAAKGRRGCRAVLFLCVFLLMAGLGAAVALVLLIGVDLTALPFLTRARQPQKNMKPKAPVAEKITAVDLAKAYDGDKAAADKRFKGKLLEVKGEIEEFEVDAKKNKNLNFKPADKLQFFRVNCYFREDQKNAVNALKVGQSLTVRGRCEGMRGNVILKDCEVVNP